MRGLEVAEAFFNDFGLPAVREHFSEVLDRMSAGLLGRGSEVLGADDQLSRDHGWGPTFSIFLRDKDFEELGKEMEARLNALRPGVFEGVDLGRQRTDPITVCTIDRHFREHTGSPWPPKTVHEWASANEISLCLAQAGKVFYDPTGELTKRKGGFEKAYYPEAIWLWRIASKLYRLWHYGDYNIRGRLARRDDGIAALVGQGHFVEAAMQLAFLLNRRFAPHWKWLHWAFLQLPCLAGELELLLKELESASDVAARADRVGAICQLCRRALCQKGIFPDDNWRNFMGSFELVDQRVADPEVRRLIGDYLERHQGL